MKFNEYQKLAQQTAIYKDPMYPITSLMIEASDLFVDPLLRGGAKGFFLLPVQDPRGYPFPHAIFTNKGWRIIAGCRAFSIERAKAHWGESYKGDREIGDMYLYAIEWLEKKLERESE